MCVSCDLLHLLVSSSLFVFISRRTIENFPSLVALLILHDRRHLSLVPRFILRDRGRPLSLFYVLFYVEDGDCMCVRVYPCRWILSAGLLLFSFFGKGLHCISRYTSETTLDFPLVTTPYRILSLLPYTPSFAFFFCRFVGRIPSAFLPSLAHRSSGFNFVHFCFLNYFFVSSIRWRQSYFRKILRSRLLFHKSAKL